MSDKNRFLKTFTLVLLVFSLLFLSVGVTLAVYNNFMVGTTSNIIKTGTIIFSYDEGDFIGNGIKISDAYPLSDEIGKKQIGTNQYFDFTISGKTTVTDVNYEVVALKENSSDLQEDYVKIYLSEVTASGEVGSELVGSDKVKTYADLNDSTIQSGKIIYLGTMKYGDNEYSKKFRLRMWLSDDIKSTESMFNKSFSVKVNVLAY